jgi:hypothetical protein
MLRMSLRYEPKSLVLKTEAGCISDTDLWIVQLDFVFGRKKKTTKKFNTTQHKSKQHSTTTKTTATPWAVPGGG